MGQVERHPMRPAESRIYREFHNNGFGRIICPACKVLVDSCAVLVEMR